MYTKSMVLPLTPDGTLYGLFDKDGLHIGSGSREVCYTLLYMINSWVTDEQRSAKGRVNKRARTSPKRSAAKAG